MRPSGTVTWTMWGSKNKTELVAEAAALQRENQIQAERIEELKAQIAHLEEQVGSLQRALVAKAAPAAFADMVEDETPRERPEWVEKRLKEAEVYKAIADQEESPLFRDPEDMFSLLRLRVGIPTPGSTHSNEES